MTHYIYNRRSVIFAFVSSMNSVPWGGSEILWYEVAEQLATSGQSVALCTPMWPQCPGPIRIAIDEWGVQHCFDRSAHARSIPARIATLLFGRSTSSFYRAWLRQTKPRILCISNGNAFEGLLWMEAAMAEAVPFLTIAQAHAEFLAPSEADSQRLIKAFSAARVNYFVSRANQVLVEAQLGWRFPNSQLIANHSRYLPTTSPFPWPDGGDGSVRLACVARLHTASKGQDLLFEALADSRWRDRNLHLTLYGAGEQEQGLHRLAAMLGISHRVHFRGQISNPMEIWATHHALVLPSRYEGMPLVLMEAMLAGRPVITTAVAGAPELIRHGHTGFLADAPTVQHLQRCMEEAWARKAEWPLIGRSAHSVAAQRASFPPAEYLAKHLLELVAR